MGMDSMDGHGSTDRRSAFAASTLSILIVVFMLAGVTAVAWGQRAPARKPLPGLLARLSERDVDDAIERAIKFLWIRQKSDGSWIEVNRYNSMLGRHPGGTTALAMLALIEAGQPITSPRMQKAIGFLLKVKMINTYAISLRTMVVSRLHKKTPADRYAKKLKEDLRWLLKDIERHGAWGYKGADRRGDNSCSQYALLAVWEAVTNGRAEISTRAWERIKKLWLSRQRRDGGWMYASSGPANLSSTGTMTAAGLASLFICLEEVDLRRRNPCSGARGPTERAIDRGLAWFNKKLDPNFALDGYYAFGVARVALASGQKYIGGHDWYRIGLGHLAVRKRQVDRWKGPYGPDVQAAFYLLFLLRGRVPVVFNKLSHGGDWDLAARDTANLTRWISRNFEIPMTWQIVEIDRDVRELMDAPVLAIGGRKALDFNAVQTAKLKEFVLRGGVIFGDALCKSQVFIPSFKTLGETMFAMEAKAHAVAGKADTPFTWRKLPADHPLFSAHYRMVRPPEIWGMSDGVREIMLLSTVGLGEPWQRRLESQNKPAFRMGANLFFYTTAREPLRTRLRPIFLGTPAKGERVLKIGLLGAVPRWPSRRYAMEQVAHKIADDARATIKFVPLAVGAKALKIPTDLTLLWVVGHTWPRLSKTDTAAILAHLRGGGMMFATAAKGDNRFSDDFRAWMRAAQPGCRVDLLDADHKLISGDMRHSRPIEGFHKRERAPCRMPRQQL